MLITRRHATILILIVAITDGAWAQDQAEPFRFVDATAESGIVVDYHYGSPERPWITDSSGSGAGWVDYDVDGWPDLLVLNGLPGPSDRPYEATAAGHAGTPLAESRKADGSVPTHAFFRNNRSGFDRVTTAGLDESYWPSAVAVGDVDNDGFDDIYVTAIGANRLYRNNGDGSFDGWDIGADDPRWGAGAAFLDFDLDGDLDLYVANYVDFDPAATATLDDDVCVFLAIEVFCGPRGLAGDPDVLLENTGSAFRPWPGFDVDPESLYGFAVLATDCDGVPGDEIYVANDSQMNLLYRRQSDGLEDLSLFSGAGYSGGGQSQAGMGLTSADYDGDGDFDLLVTNFQHDYNTLYRNLGDCTFEDTTAQAGLAAASYPYMGWAPLLLDFDGDGDEDLFVANGHLYPQLEATGLEPFDQRNLLFRNSLRETGAARFDEVGAESGPGLQSVVSSRSAAAADADRDGDLDLVVTNISEPPVYLRNDTAMRSAVLRVRLVGRDSSRNAYGAVLRVTSGGFELSHELRHGDGFLGSNDTAMLVFLPGGSADTLEVHWPGGGITQLENVMPGQVVIDQRRGVIAGAGS